MSEPRWSIQAPREEGAPFLLYGGVMVGRLYGGAPVSEMLRLLNAEDADILRQARVLVQAAMDEVPTCDQGVYEEILRWLAPPAFDTGTEP